MTNIIQQVVIGENESLYIIDFDKSNNNLTFRVSNEPKFLQQTIVKQEGNMILCDDIVFDINFLLQFLEINNIE